MPGSPEYTIPYSFQPGESVWVIVTCDGTPKVEGATIVRVRGEVVPAQSPTVEYDIRLDSAASGSQVALDANIFLTLDRAIAEYQARLAAM